MENRIEKATNYFSKGFNCSQSILAVYGPLFALDEITALKIATGFGSGMGALQNTCGAVTGAFMTIGLAHGKWKSDDNEAKQKTYSSVRKFADEFTKVNCSINCLTLLGCDISTPEGLSDAQEKNLFETKCKKYIRDAAAILETMLDMPTQE